MAVAGASANWMLYPRPHHRCILYHELDWDYLRGWKDGWGWQGIINGGGANIVIVSHSIQGWNDDTDVLARAILTKKLISVRYGKIEFWHRFSIHFGLHHHHRHLRRPSGCYTRGKRSNGGVPTPEHPGRARTNSIRGPGRVTASLHSRTSGEQQQVRTTS